MRRAARLLPLLVLALLPFLFLHRGLTGDADRVLGKPGWDMATLFYPQKIFAVRSISQGDFPLWNPYLFCGLPFHAAMHAGLLYPPNLLFLALPAAAAVNLLFVLHVALAGLLAYGLIREAGARPSAALVGALGFSLSARVLLHVHAGHFPHVASLAWTPGILWFAARLARTRSARDGVFLAGAFALAVLAGFPQYPAYAAAAAVALAAGRALPRPRAAARDLALVAGALAGGALLAAAQIAPALEAARDSFRAAAKAGFIGTGFFPIENLATFLFPSWLGDSLKAPYFGKWSVWEMVAYPGVATLLFAGVAIANREGRARAAPWAALALAAALLAFGIQTPLFAIQSALPLLGGFRGASKWIALAVLALCVCSGLGLEALLAERERRRSRAAGGQPARRAFLVLATAAAALGGLAMLLHTGDGGARRAAADYARYADANEHYPGGLPQASPELIESVRRERVRDAARVTAVAAALLLVVFAGRAVAPVAAALLAVDLFLVFDPYLATLSVAEDVRLPREVETSIRQFSPIDRYGASERWMMPGAYYGAPAIGGWEGNLPRRTVRFLNFVAGRPLDAPGLSFQPSRLSPLLDLLVMRQLLLPGVAPIDSTAFRLTASGPGFAAYERTRGLPRAFLAHHVEVAADPAAVWAAVRDGRVAPRDAATVESALDAPPLDEPQGGSEEECELVVEHADRVGLRVTAAGRAFLVLLDPWAPGWRATVDRRPVRVVPVLGFFRGVAVPGGAHEVDFTYAPRSMTVGVAVSLAACAAAAAILVAGRRRRSGSGRGPVRSGT